MKPCKLSKDDLLLRLKLNANDDCPICEELVCMHVSVSTLDNPFQHTAINSSASTNPASKVQSTITFTSNSMKTSIQPFRALSTRNDNTQKQHMKQPNLEYSLGYLKGVSFIGKDCRHRTKPLEDIQPLLKKHQVMCNICGATIGNPGALVVSASKSSLISHLTSSLCSVTSLSVVGTNIPPIIDAP